MNLHFSKDQIFPIMGLKYSAADFHSVSLDKDHLKEIGVQIPSDLEKHLRQLAIKHQAQWLFGGYLEHRALYKSTLFSIEKEDVRDIHLGIDIWGAVGAPIHSPIDGCIHSFAYNGFELDYGYTVILEHEVGQEKVHTLFGHLSSEFYSHWKLGASVKKGEVIGKIGAHSENGGWLPHLHFQVIIDMERKKGDYPGVCSALKLKYYQANCPDPSILIKK